MKLQKAVQRIEEFRKFKSNWNGYGAEPISEKVIDKALQLVKQLKPTPKVFPTACNSIQLEWETDNLYLEMEVFKDTIEIFNHASFDVKAIGNIGGD